MPVVRARKASIHYRETFSGLKRVTRAISRLRKETAGRSAREALRHILTGKKHDVSIAPKDFGYA